MMYRFRVGNVHVQTIDADEQDAAWDAQVIMQGLFNRRKTFPKVMRAHARSHRLSLRPILLIAHGAIRDGRWHYVDPNGRTYSVQRWIDTHDGKAGTLLLFCCNRLNREIRSRSSLVIHLNRAINRHDLFQGGCLRLHHPEFGYIEDNYYRLHSIIRA